MAFGYFVFLIVNVHILTALVFESSGKPAKSYQLIEVGDPDSNLKVGDPEIGSL